MDNLMDRRMEVKDEKEVAEKEGNKIRAQVDEWLEDVNNLQLRVNPIQEKMVNMKKPIACFLKCSMRCRAGEVEAIREEIKRLLEAGSFPTGMVHPTRRPRAVEHIPVPSIRGQTTASKLLDETMELLYDDEVGRIGIWGLGGIGKTTLVNNLNNELKTTSTQPFSIVIWAKVSKNLDIKHVQTQIARRLLWEPQMGESEQEMAIRLHQRLKNEKFVLILDDLWEEIDLDILGVPRPEEHEGCKIILTSRRMEVCRKMKTDKEVKMNVLNDEETWQLFCQNAGDVVHSEEIKPFAEAIARECCGLPLAINIVGAAMRRQEEDGIEDKVYRSLKLSYDSLEGLLSVGRWCQRVKEGTVKMHDLVRDVAIWISESSEDGCKSLVRSGIKLSEISVQDLSKLNSNSRQRVSFMDNKITRLPDSVIQCSESSSLLLQHNLALEMVPVRFLQGFIALRLLNLGNTRIQSLPPSLLQLGDLRALLLRNCSSLGELPPLGGFSRLQMLNLGGTGIRELPRGLENLCNLKLLDLSDTENLKTIQAGIISRLSCLEDLQLKNSAYHFHFNGEEKRGDTTFEDLRSGDGLFILSITFKSIPRLSSEDVSWIKRLRAFQIFIGQPPLDFHPRITTTNEKIVIIGRVDFPQESIKELWCIAKSLVLDNCRGLNEMVKDLAINIGGCFDGLSSLTITGDNMSLRPTGQWAASCDLLPNLEELIIKDNRGAWLF
uniref:NB-ARC domain-containing protein n=1 Tax=Fagus sylvatica TaxID=28930 RepID=A0A2N9F1A8_FAGSY